MADETVAVRIREFLRDLFGSRLTAHLEEELMRTRSDYETRLMERERTIADLRSDVAALTAKVDRYELVVIPLASPIGEMMRGTPKRREATFKEKPEPPVLSTWEEIQRDYELAQQAEAQAERTP